MQCATLLLATQKKQRKAWASGIDLSINRERRKMTDTQKDDLIKMQREIIESLRTQLEITHETYKVKIETIDGENGNLRSQLKDAIDNRNQEGLDLLYACVFTGFNSEDDFWNAVVSMHSPKKLTLSGALPYRRDRYLKAFSGFIRPKDKG